MSNPDVQTLLEECISSAPGRQIAAIQSLLDLKVYAAVPRLVEGLKSPSSMVRAVAAQALGPLGAKNSGMAGAALLELLQDPDAVVRSDAVDALGILRFVPAVEPIKRVLMSDREPLVRASAAETLGDLGDPRALAELELALGDPDEAVRAYAANSIGLLGTSRLLPKLQGYIASESSPQVRAELHGARYRLGAREDLAVLLKLLSTADGNLAPNLMNIFEDLTRRNSPSSLADDANSICQLLSDLEQRMPSLNGDAKLLMARLEKIKPKAEPGV